MNAESASTGPAPEGPDRLAADNGVGGGRRMKAGADADRSRDRVCPEHVPETILAPVKAAVMLAGVVLVATACSSSSSRPANPTMAAAQTFRLDGFQPAQAVAPGRSFEISFRIAKPGGGTLTAYRTGPGPHTGVHLIVVRDDLSTLVHRHPPIAADGTIRQRLVLPEGGRYRVLVDVYPRLAGPLRNFQLTGNVDVSGAAPKRPLPPFRPTEVVDGYRVTLHGAGRIKAVSPTFADVTVTDPTGRPARFSEWYGALAHAIFFRAGSLDYFHTHVCGAAASACASAVGGTRIVGKSTKAGRLNVGILLPVPGKWRLFLQFKPGAHVVTAPFTLTVR
ncbi:MAG: hypothetical protein QOD08_1798 [Gaiellaceae bacterium]|nr:hypothetical protein [Gaiellaceae bacterium]